MAYFDEKFQINTKLELDKETGLPTKEKVSTMTAVIDYKYMPNATNEQKGTVLEIATAEFNMADF